MRRITFPEFKNWLKKNKEQIKTITIRIQSPNGTKYFKTLKDLGEYVLMLEKQHTSVCIYSYMTTTNPGYKSFIGDEAENIDFSQLRVIFITVGNSF